MSFQTINNTTPFFEGTDTHALMGNSSYSTTGTTSFSAIHTEVAGQEYIPFGAPATTSGPRRIGRDEFIGNENNGNAVGKDEEVPTGDMLLPLLVMAACTRDPYLILPLLYFYYIVPELFPLYANYIAVLVLPPPLLVLTWVEQ